MKFTTLTMIAAFAVSSVIADLHYVGICVDRTDSGDIYNSDATEQACTWYHNRNTGDEQWDQCPDCVMTTSNGSPVCSSPAKHIGGDELAYYCQQAGADDGQA